MSLDLLIRSLIMLGVSLMELGRIMGFDEPEPVRVQETAAAQDTTGLLNAPLAHIKEGRREGASNAG